MPRYRIIFKKTSSFTRSTNISSTAKAIEQYVTRYQDEVGKAAQNLQRGRTANAEGKHAGTNEPEADTWKHPLTHRSGILWAGGFFGDKRSPGKAKPNHQKSWIKEFSKDWAIRLRPHKKRKHDGARLTFSLSEATMQELTRCGMAPETAAMEILRETMAIYAKKHGWSPESLGWLAGFHHDKTNTHLHLIIFPTTKEGELLKMSNQNKNGPEVRDDLTDLTAAGNIAAEAFYRRFLPFTVQTPEVQLAWIRGQEPPDVKMEDYRVENPLGDKKYLTAEEKDDIRQKRKDGERKEAAARELVQIELTRNPARADAFQGSGLPISTESALEKLFRHWVYNDTTEHCKAAVQGEGPEVNPESKNPEQAQRAVDIIGAFLGTASSHLGKIEDNIQLAITNIETIQKEKADPPQTAPSKTSEPWDLLQASWRKILKVWNKQKLGFTKWRLQRLANALKEPSLRARLLINLQNAHTIEAEKKGKLETPFGLDSLLAYAREQSLSFQKESEALMGKAKTEEEQGARLWKRLQDLNLGVGRAKKEAALILSLKTLLNKTVPIPDLVRPLTLLSEGSRLRLRLLSDQKEASRARIILRNIGNKKPPIPAKAGKKPPETLPTTGPRSGPAKFEALRLPNYLNPVRIEEIISSRKSAIEEKKLQEQTPGLAELGKTPMEKEKERQKAEAEKKSPWVAISDRGLLNTILLEMERRKGKERDL